MPGCTNVAAYKTKSKPSWCLDCIGDIMRVGGLSSDEPFEGPDAWRLTTCLDCGVQAHYKFSYTCGKNARGEKTCRACHWKSWAKMARARKGISSPEAKYSADAIVAHLEAHGFTLIATTSDINDGNDPIIACCSSCGRISAERMRDIAFGCHCSRNGRSARPATGAAPKSLLSESEDDALSWWDHNLNSDHDFRTATLRATRLCHWLCPDCGSSFDARVMDMTGGRHECPDCAVIRAAQDLEQHEKWKTTPVSEVSALAECWANAEDPAGVMVVGSAWPSTFVCIAGHFASAYPDTYLKRGCPSCRAAETRRTQKNWLSEVLPEIASQWHPERNGKFTPEDTVWNSKRDAWWVSDCCGHEWLESPRNRDKYTRLRCPRCRTILDSLAWQNPGLASEWSSENPESAWAVRPQANTPYVPIWVCAKNKAHVWVSPVASRSAGSQCPECRVAGKSRVELSHYDAAQELFMDVRSGAVLRSPMFESKASWTADICMTINGYSLVVEYDGAYWHEGQEKFLTDERKTTDLLLAGFVVVRLRENDLRPLRIQNSLYKEIRVYSTRPRPQEVMTEILGWANQIQPHPRE